MTRAKAEFEKAIQIDPGNAEAHGNLGNIYSNERRFESAVKHYRRAANIDPGRPQYHSSLGIALRRLGKLAEAKDHLQRAVRLQPNHAKAHHHLALTLIGQAKPGQAKVHFEKAVASDPDLHSAQNDLAWLLATESKPRLRDGTAALRWAHRAGKATGYRDARYLDTLAAAYAETGRFDEAVRWQKKVIELVPQSAKPASRARLALYESGKPYRQRSVDTQE